MQNSKHLAGTAVFCEKETANKLREGMEKRKEILSNFRKSFTKRMASSACLTLCLSAAQGL